MIGPAPSCPCEGPYKPKVPYDIIKAMTSNRIEPAVIIRRKSLNNSKKKFLVPETVTESFEWVASGGRGARSRDILKHLGIQALFAISLIYLPWYLLKFLKNELNPTILACNENDMSKDFDHLDMVRISCIFGMGWLIYIFAMGLLHFIVNLMKNSRDRSRSIPSSVQKTMETIKFMGPYISMCCGVVAMGSMIKHYYPASMDLRDVISVATNKAREKTSEGVEVEGGTKDKKDGDIDQAFSLFVNVIETILTLGRRSKTLYLKNMIPIIVNTFAIFVIVLTFEKFILQMIAINYRSGTTAGRFTENAFALSVFKELFRTKLNYTSTEKLGSKFDPETTGMLFEAIAVRDGESYGDVINLSHLENEMEHQQAAKLFGILDVAQNGDLIKEEFVSAVQAVYDEQETLSKLLEDHDDIISKIDEIMLIGVYSIDFALCLTFLGIPGLEMFTTVLGLMVAFGFFFKDALTKAFDSLVLVLITHPYDLGDRVEIHGKYMYVESVGLWTTTFIGPGGLKTIMTNASLADEKIANFRRSPAENEIFTFLVRPETVNEESVRTLREDCVQFFKQHKREFLPSWHLETYDQIDSERFKLIIKIFHRHNFQNEEAKNDRSQKFALFFKDALIRNGFLFSPAYPRAMAAPIL